MMVAPFHTKPGKWHVERAVRERGCLACAHRQRIFNAGVRCNIGGRRVQDARRICGGEWFVLKQIGRGE